ncbi:hypothetical protein POK33_39285 [Burkholderia cenocepacia]|uniref:hypothetical protein n=1 Tax=Burkholderia cenocepacia TaxID=95486 RepID=UPI0023B9709D|nr:hypothetical protein [Burkholderia cenocepacia]MDF0506800.1 hypothetical protein [Burkholderia cenocepacia]
MNIKKRVMLGLASFSGVAFSVGLVSNIFGTKPLDRMALVVSLVGIASAAIAASAASRLR